MQTYNLRILIRIRFPGCSRYINALEERVGSNPELETDNAVDAKWQCFKNHEHKLRNTFNPSY